MTAIPKKPVGSKGPRGPRIERIVAASGRGIGRARRAAEAGTTLRIIGGGFGRDSTSVQVLFDETPVRPFRQPFSTSELLVTAPLLAKRTTSLRVRAGRRTSNPIRFTLRRPLTHLVPPGEATHPLHRRRTGFPAGARVRPRVTNGTDSRGGESRRGTETGDATVCQAQP